MRPRSSPSNRGATVRIECAWCSGRRAVDVEAISEVEVLGSLRWPMDSATGAAAFAARAAQACADMAVPPALCARGRAASDELAAVALRRGSAAAAAPQQSCPEDSQSHQAPRAKRRRVNRRSLEGRHVYFLLEIACGLRCLASDGADRRSRGDQTGEETNRGVNSERASTSQFG